MPPKRRLNSKSTLGRPKKRQRRCLTETSNSPVSGSASLYHQDTSYLNKLPSELITKIWEFSREPALIHACRRMYEELPSYIGFTKCLAALAFFARLYDRSDLHAIFSDLLMPVPRIEIPYDTESRHRLQSEVLTSKWFRAEHLPTIFKENLQRVVRFELSAKTSYKMPFTLWKGQQRKLDRFLQQADPVRDCAFPSLFLRAKCATDPTLKIGIHHNHLTFHDRHSYGSTTVAQVTDMRHIPDALMTAPFTRQKALIISEIPNLYALWNMRAAWSYGGSLARLTCSRKCLGKYLKHIATQDYTDDNFEVFLALLKVAKLCDHNPDSDLAVVWDLLELAAVCDQPKYVYHILTFWAETSKLAMKPRIARYLRDTAGFESIRDHLRDNVPSAESRDLIELELAFREYLQMLHENDPWSEVSRSTHHPFCATIYDHYEVKVYIPDGVDLILQGLGIDDSVQRNAINFMYG